ncbi:ubiquitin 3 binding protein But2 C-terminal domain-containing protein [Hypoxylon fragiforme]|uniref:ubiquitin 3 binding protein But2 C-terminal domain-containing protein n=1 Tax=Hypoxylon fragiforme TaxID=63214 RepID=UPI0020C6C750|nr:ubiquitin 3 binding protein But2 C-terminal domain-containing protein [Hypoxylon fragiforme]KAI2603232.1 ubiquitin 3 binding protein But2 C-terminal domain-containing protein [Hypoxylon fragiforme]
MYTLLYLAVLFSTATAAPFELISKRPLHDNQWKRDSTTNCPAYLPDGEYEFPHYITWISQQQPDRAFGSQYEGRVTPGDISSIFSFDVPASRADANCTLEFLFPRQDQLSSSSFTYEGPGNFQFTGYLAGSCPGPETTFNNQPTPGMFPPFPPIHMEPGFAYTLDVGPCTFAAGTCVAGGEPGDFIFPFSLQKLRIPACLLTYPYFFFFPERERESANNGCVR